MGMLTLVLVVVLVRTLGATWCMLIVREMHVLLVDMVLLLRLLLLLLVLLLLVMMVPLPWPLLFLLLLLP